MEAWSAVCWHLSSRRIADKLFLDEALDWLPRTTLAVVVDRAVLQLVVVVLIAVVAAWTGGLHGDSLGTVMTRGASEWLG